MSETRQAVVRLVYFKGNATTVELDEGEHVISAAIRPAGGGCYVVICRELVETSWKRDERGLTPAHPNYAPGGNYMAESDRLALLAATPGVCRFCGAPKVPGSSADGPCTTPGHMFLPVEEVTP